MFCRKPWNLKTRNLPTVKCRDELQSVKRNRVSEASFASRNVATSLSRDVFASPILNSTSVHVESMKPVFGGSSCFFHTCRLPSPEKALASSMAASYFAAFQAPANLHKQQELFSRPAKSLRGEKPYACGGEESRISRFTICSANVWKFAKCDFATTCGSTISINIRISKDAIDDLRTSHSGAFMYDRNQRNYFGILCPHERHSQRR